MWMRVRVEEDCIYREDDVEPEEVCERDRGIYRR